MMMWWWQKQPQLVHAVEATIHVQQAKQEVFAVWPEEVALARQERKD